MSKADDLFAEARKRGLAITSQGVNMDALAGSVPDRALGAGINPSFLATSFRVNCNLSENEEQFQDSVVMLAHGLGWKVVHIRKVLVKMGDRTHYETPFDLDGAGSFDLDFYRERHFKAELKFGRNVPQDNQLAWKVRYDAAGVENYIWYPKDCEQIIEVLTCHRPAKR